MKNSTSSLVKGYIAILFAMLFWGISFVWTKQLLNNNIPVFTIILIRLTIASVCFVSLFKIKGLLEKIQPHDLKYFLLLSFFEPFLYFIGEDFGLKFVDASYAAVIIALIPIIVSITMYFAENEPIRWEFILGATISVFGVLLLTLSPNGSFAFSLKGTLLLCLALAAAAGYSVLLSRLLKKYRPLTVTTYQNLIAIPFYLPFVLVFDVNNWSLATWDAYSWVCLICLALFCSAGAYMLYSYSVKCISVTKTVIFTNLIPIVTLIVAAIIGQETFTQTKFWGILVVVVGVIMSQSRLKKQTP